MNLITRNNYEAYLLDYVEENLSLELIAELTLFLENNPDLKEEIDEFEVHELIPPITTLENKSSLKKDNSVTLNNYEELIIAEVEGVNTPETSKELHSFLVSNPSHQTTFLSYQKTKLAAPSIIFNDKKSLKKKEGKVIPMYWWYSSAAAVIIILFLLNMINNGDEQNEHPIANKKEVVFPTKEKENNVVPDVILVEENKIQNVEIEQPKQIVKKTPLPVFEEQNEENTTVLVDNPDEKEVPANDSIPQEINKELPTEEIQYADNVKITYEEDVAPKKKITRLDMVQAAIKERAKESNLNKAKEKLVLAFNSKPLSFLKKKDKN